MKFLRVARLDDTDDHVYELAAQVGELAVPGSFVFDFSEQDPAELTGKQKQAFRHAFLGTSSFGWATVVVITEITEAQYKSVVEALAQHFVAEYGAPSLEEALPVARAEAEYAAGLCEHEVGSLLALERSVDAEGIHESFKLIKMEADWSRETRIWDMVPDDEQI